MQTNDLKIAAWEANTKTWTLNRAEAILKYSWRDQSLLATALRHSSWCNENRPSESNERLEFLGDSVLDLLTAHQLYQLHPQQREGFLSEERAKRVRTESLAAAARRFSLNQLLYLGKGSQALRNQDSVLADFMEALIGAAYMDGGLNPARNIAKRVGIL